MQFSKNWIGEYVDLPESVSEVADRLTAAGLAVEGIEARGSDHVLDIDVTTNRPDCMNHLGLARELSAILGTELRLPEGSYEPAEESASAAARLVVEDFDRCPSYTALVLRGVRVGPSPDWLVERLEAIGSRSINNIVDVTNYVLWETGQPLHAFDLGEIAAGSDGLPELHVRAARDGETLKTLDAEKRSLDPSILVIADPSGPIALGGIMGGFDSEVTERTVDVLLECAHFDTTTVRKGSKKLGLHTDASHRYERGADPRACLWAAKRAAALMVELAGGEILDGHLEETELRADWPPVLEIDTERLARFGGRTVDGDWISHERSVEILRRLGFAVEELAVEELAVKELAVKELAVEGQGGTRIEVTVPSWRYYDFEGAHAQDVYEEVLRIYGFDRIASSLPALGAPDAPASPAQVRRRKVQDVLAACGFAETINFAFHERAVDEAYPTFYSERAPMELANALSDLYAVMRRSLLPNLVSTALYNQRRGATAVRVFEIGHVFAAEGDEAAVEMETVGIVLGGRLGTPWEHQVDLDFYDLKGVIEALALAIGQKPSFHAAERRKMMPGTVAEVRLGEDTVVGYLGQLDEPDLVYPVFVAELSLDHMGDGTVSLETRTPSRFPGITVDLTFTHPLSTPWREIREAIEAAEVEDLQEAALENRYQGEGVPEGAVNTTITFRYNSEARSLTQDEVNERHRALAESLEARFGLADS